MSVKTVLGTTNMLEWVHTTYKQFLLFVNHFLSVVLSFRASPICILSPPIFHFFFCLVWNSFWIISFFLVSVFLNWFSFILNWLFLVSRQQSVGAASLAVIITQFYAGKLDCCFIMIWLSALNAGAAYCIPCRCRHRRRAHGLDDCLVRVGGPEATALATTVSRSLTSSTSPVGSHSLLTRHIVTSVPTLW